MALASMCGSDWANERESGRVGGGYLHEERRAEDLLRGCGGGDGGGGRGREAEEMLPCSRLLTILVGN